MTDNPQDQPTEGEQPPYTSPPPPPVPPPYQAPAYGQQAQAPVSPADAHMWSMLGHLGGILFGFIPSLVVYLIYKDRDPFIRRHSTQALNFQIIAAIAYVVSGFLPIIGILIGFAAFVCVVVFSIMAAMAANKGEEYTYPLIPKIVA